MLKKVVKVIILSGTICVATNCSKDKDTNGDANSSFCETNKQNNYFLYGQEEVDAFDAKNCEVIYGSIYISDSEDSRVTDLSSLSNLKTVGDLSIENTKSLKSLKGLENLTRIRESLASDLFSSANGSLSILRNDELSDISALNNLENIEGELTISGNDKLTNLNSLNSLENMYKRVVISDNNSLVEISGLNALTSINGTSINGHIQIYDNPLLTSISGFNSLLSMTYNQSDIWTTITPKVKIVDNSMLNDFCGLQALAKNVTHNDNVDVDFEVEGNKYNPSVRDISSESDCRN